MTELQKLVKKKVREDLKEFENSKIKQIIDETWSTKKEKKELRRGKNLITKIKDKERKEIYGREVIVETITGFCEDL